MVLPFLKFEIRNEYVWNKKIMSFLNTNETRSQIEWDANGMRLKQERLVSQLKKIICFKYILFVFTTEKLEFFICI